MGEANDAKGSRDELRIERLESDLVLRLETTCDETIRRLEESGMDLKLPEHLG